MKHLLDLVCNAHTICYSTVCLISILVTPSAVRQVRARLKLTTEKAVLEIFAIKLKQMFLMPPLKGKPILGIDTDCKNDCKIALISSTGAVVLYNTIYPHKSRKNGLKAAEILKKLFQEQK